MTTAATGRRTRGGRWRLAWSVLIAVALAATGLTQTPAAIAAGGPPAVSVKFGKSLATVSWGAVSGANKYTVVVSRNGYSGPFRGYTTSGTSINIAYSGFPYATAKSGKAFKFSVTANGKNWSSATGVVKVSLTGTKVSTSNKTAAANKVLACISSGSAAALVAGTATGVVAVATVWIPGANAVSASTFLTTMGVGFATGYITCLTRS